MNAHIWELDKCENKNGKLLKSVMDEINLQILNCVWDSMDIAMAQVGEELNEEMDNWCENRKGWVTDRVKDCIAEQKKGESKVSVHEETCRADDVITERQKEIYMRKKEDARQELGMALHVHNEMVIKRSVKVEIKVDCMPI